MLHSRPGDADHTREVKSTSLKPFKDQIHSFEPHGRGSVDFALVRIRQDAFLDTIFLGIFLVKVDFCFVDEFQVRADNNASSDCQHY